MKVKLRSNSPGEAFDFTFDDVSRNFTIIIHSYSNSDAYQREIYFSGGILNGIMFNLHYLDVFDLYQKLLRVKNESDVRRVMIEYFIKYFDRQRVCKENVIK